MSRVVADGAVDSDEKMDRLIVAIRVLADELERQESEIAALSKSLTKAKEEATRLRRDVSVGELHYNEIRRQLDAANNRAPEAIAGWLERTVANWPIGEGVIYFSPEGMNTSVIYLCDCRWESAAMDDDCKIVDSSVKSHDHFADAWRRAIELSSAAPTARW